MKPLFTINSADRELFRQTVGAVQPLHCDRIDPVPIHPIRLMHRICEDEYPTFSDRISDAFEPDLDTAQELYYRRAGIQQTLLRKLRRGRLPIGAVLDLHGMTVAAAKQALTAFLHHACHEQQYCVRVIHGKGKGSPGNGSILKQKVNIWLRQHHAVLAFCAARRNDGGSGALYVLLQRM